MMQWKGFAIFIDGDMIVKDDIANLWNLRDYYKAAQVVQHDYKTKHPVKYLGARNDDYPRKNWSSVILWNCGHFANRTLEPEYIGKSNGSHLHRFGWLKDELVGSLPVEWNQLVEEYPDRESSLYHYTIGIPAFKDYAECDRSDDWWAEYAAAVAPC